LGPYQLLRRIAKGGMGEIHLAYDPICRRNIALKRVRKELIAKESIRRRFLREAWITSQLSHPGVIPIYNIHAEEEHLYYTMPYLEGETLRDLLRRTRKAAKEGRPTAAEQTIRGLMRSFLSVCQTIAYAHSRSIIHRDLKPDNIIIGKYGEVAILDWGLARWTFEEEEMGDTIEGYGETADLTVPGRIFGTLSHLAPECCLGEPASRRSDIFSLGVILYQILTLTLPFDRPSLKGIEETVKKEKFVDPAKVAPYRDVPMALGRVVERCLQHDPAVRYAAVDDLIDDLRAYMIGQADWFEVAHLEIDRFEDWEMAEYIFMPQKLAVTGHAEGSEWARVMISRESFSGNCRLSCRLRILEEGEGLGLLMSVGEEGAMKRSNQGLCMWLGSDPDEGSKLFRAAAEVSSIPDLFLERGRWFHVDLRKEQSNLYLYIDGQLVYTYLNYLPVMGTHVGLLCRDGEFEIEGLTVSVGNLSLKVDCLAIPDAFLEAKIYDRALSEYRRISASFPDRSEGRSAQFRAGITLLEQAQTSRQESELFEEALDEFGKLHSTPAAPLEYLGKSLVYHSMEEADDEVNMLELAIRRYPNHPMISSVREHIRVRLFETARIDRRINYRYALLIAHKLPDLLDLPDTASHMAHLQTHWEPLPFLMPIPERAQLPEMDRYLLAVPLAFWLAKPYTLAELLDEVGEGPPTAIANGLSCLIQLGSYQLTKERLDNLEREWQAPLRAAITAFEENSQAGATQLLAHCSGAPPALFLSTALFLADRALSEQQSDLVHYIVDQLPGDLITSPAVQIEIDARTIWAHLLDGRWEKAAELFSRYPLELLDDETSLLRTLFGCWLAVTEGVEIAQVHFEGVVEKRYPRSCALLSHYLAGRAVATPEWEKSAFLWERRALYRQLSLYYHCTGESEQEIHFQNLERREQVDVPE